MKTKCILTIEPPPSGQILIVAPTLYFCEESHLTHPRITWWTYLIANREEIPWDVHQVIIYNAVLSRKRQRELELRALEKGICDVHRVKSFDALLDWIDRLPRDFEDSIEYIQARLKRYFVGKNGKEHMTSKSGKPFLVVGADTTAFDEKMLRDPRVHHWGAGDVHEGAVIPEGVEEIIYCDSDLRRPKVALLKTIVRETQATGRDIKSWEVPHQVRLREVLTKELNGTTPIPEPVGSDEMNDDEIGSLDAEEISEIATETETFTQDTIPGEVVVEGSVPEPNPDTSGGSGDASENDNKGDVETMERMSIPDIVRASMEETGGNIEALAKIVRKQYPTMPTGKLKAALYGPRAGWLKKRSTPNGQAGTEASHSDKPSKSPEPPKKLSLKERYDNLMGQFERLFGSFQGLEAEINAALDRPELTPDELALIEVARNLNKKK